MGLIIPTDTDYLIRGDNCAPCTPDPYPVGQQPKFMWARFFDVQACPGVIEPPNNRVIKMEQVPTIACVYNGFLGSSTHYWWVQYVMFTGELILTYATPGPWFAVFYCQGDPCDLNFPVNERNCTSFNGFDGRAEVGYFEDTLLHSLTSDYHMVPRDHLYYERQEVGMDHKIVRLASKRYSTNILILIDTQDFEFVEFPL